MSDIKRLPWWKRRHSLSAGESILVGAASGAAASIVSACTPPRDFSVSFLLLLLLSIVPCGGIAGYMIWLSGDPASEQRLRRITSLWRLSAS
jgi:hypothetical protein